MFSVSQKGDFSKTTTFLKVATSKAYLGILDDYGRRGVEALKLATPMDSGETASSWDYKITRNPNRITITWTNSVMAGSTPLAILLQYGHGTRNGGYVQGRDFINPAIRPIFDDLANELWKTIVNS